MLEPYTAATRSSAFVVHMQHLVQVMVRTLVDAPRAVKVTSLGGETIVKLEIQVAPQDREKVIGPQGRTLDALQTLARAAGARAQRRVLLGLL